MADDLAHVSDADWKTFHPYPCLVMIEPVNDEGGCLWKPYRGEAYDPAVYELVDGGWDHEHCAVCWARVEAGDRYWADEGGAHVDLCPTCHPLVVRELERRADFPPKVV